VYHYPYRLDVQRMIDMAPLFAGEHDFSAFAASDDRDALGGSKVRNIFHSQVTIDHERLSFRARGNGFLKHMVRNLVGTLIEAGKGNVGPRDLRGYFERPQETKAGPSLPSRGLFLVSVQYEGEDQE
jgi:tRNA pseudouridine38-40 synthase